MMKLGDPKYRYIYAAWGFLECLGFGGLLYGWGSLVFVLKDEGIYLDLCDQSDPVNTTTEVVFSGNNDSSNSQYSKSVAEAGDIITSCPERESKLALVFTIGAAMFCFGCFVMGQVNFKFGMRVTRLGAAALFIAGSLMIAFTSTDIPWLIFPGLSLLGAGGITYLMTNLQISVLFPVGGSSLVGLLCGGFDSSSGIQLMMKLGYENGISRSTSYIILSCTHVLTLISTFFFMPKNHLQKPAEPKGRKEAAFNDDEAAVEFIDVAGNGKSDKEMTSQAPVPSLSSCLMSPSYILHICWFSILQLRFYYLLASLNAILEMRLDTKEEVSQYTNVMMYVLMCGLISSPLAGIFYDFFIRRHKDSRSEKCQKLMPSVVPLSVTTTLCILMSALVIVRSPEVLYAVFVVLLFFRSFMYTLAAGFIGNVFPSQYLGSMYGILIFVGGVVSVFQYAFFEWAEAAGFEQVNIFLLILVCITFVHPLYQWRESRRAEQSLVMN